MKNKEKKQMLTTELTKEKSGRSAGMIQDMSINGIKLQVFQNGTGGPSSSGACIHISRTK